MDPSLIAELKEVHRLKVYQQKRAPDETALLQRWDFRRAFKKTCDGMSILEPNHTGMSILKKLSWCTLSPPTDATMLDDHNEDSRPLTDAEWNAVVREDTWMLLHPDAGLLPDSEAFPNAVRMPERATVRDVLDAVSKMTVVHGEYAIADHVYWEGLSKEVDRGLFVVRTGS